MTACALFAVDGMTGRRMFAVPPVPASHRPTHATTYTSPAPPIPTRAFLPHCHTISPDDYYPHRLRTTPATFDYPCTTRVVPTRFIAYHTIGWPSLPLPIPLIAWFAYILPFPFILAALTDG